MRVGVLGIGKTPHKIQHNKSLRDLIVEAGRTAILDAGVSPSDIQMLYVGNVGSVGFNYENSTGLMAAHHLGVVPAGAVRVEAACGTGAWALHLGVVAIASGLYDTVMVVGAEKMNDLATVEGTSVIAQAADSKEEYFSGLTFPSGVALTARKYMQTYGLTEEDLAHTSVKNHHYGARNPYAHLRFECTVEEVMRSAKVADPLKLYEVCPMTDAASSLVLCREEILRNQPERPQVYVTATQMASGTWYAVDDTLEDAYKLFHEPATRAYAMAGISADEVFRILNGTSETFEPFRPWHFMWPNMTEELSRVGYFLDREQELFTNWLSGATDPRSGRRFALGGTLGKMAQASARLLPTGIFDPDSLEGYLLRNMRRSGLPNDFTEAWKRNHKSLYLTAADINRGEMVVFGHDEPYSSVPIARAIAASCAIPLWYKPVILDNPRAGDPGEPDQLVLADGGLMRTANVRIAVEKGCELVICYNPFTRIRYDRAGRSLHEHGLPTMLSQAIRTLIGARLDLAKELVYRDDTIQADIVFIEPADDDYTFFKMNPLDFWSKAAASAHGYETVRKSIDANHEELADLFRVHGIELRPPRDAPPARDRRHLHPSELSESRGNRLRAVDERR